MTARLVVALAATIAAGALASDAHAEFGFVPGSVDSQALDAAGNPENRAGAHPDRVVTRFAFAHPNDTFEENLKEMVVDLPAGMTGDAGATPRCPRASFATGRCPPETQIGITRPVFAGFGSFELPVYNVGPLPDAVAELGFTAIVVPARFMVGLRAGDYGIRIVTPNIPQGLPMLSSELELWGVPADHQVGTSIPRRAFLTNATRCDTARRPTTLRVRTWQRPEHWTEATAPAQPLVGCDSIDFAPTVSVTPDHPAADSPTGIRIDVHVPQDDDPSGVATAHARKVSVTLPPGFTLSPGVAHGLTACTDRQLAPDSAEASSCPDSSKVGTAELTSPALAGAMAGEVYIGEPLPDDPYRLFVVTRGPGFEVKLRGSLRGDPVTGRLTATLADLPELSFSDLTLRLKDGPRAPVASPAGCGARTATAVLAPYTGRPAAEVSASVATTRGPGGQACMSPAPFAPSFVAGSSPALAGSHGALSVTVARRDGEQELGRLAITLPPGVTARLASVDRCPEAGVLAATCPASSRIGSTAVEAGAGSAPLLMRGDVHLTGPYRGAPFGIALVLDPDAGPFDLDTTVIRAMLRLDPASARLTVATDPLPRILEGIPLRLQTVAIDIDRPGFVVNPTSCTRDEVGGTIVSAASVRYRSTTPFAVRGCDGLRFEPRVELTVNGRRGRRPGLVIRIEAGASTANARTVGVRLPRLLQPALSGAIHPCDRARARTGGCPETTRIGSAAARSPMVDGRLRGPVHMVEPLGFGAPELWASLEGDGVRLVARGSTGILAGGQLRTRLVDLPDVPLDSLTVRLARGERSLFEPLTHDCGGPRAGMDRARATLRAHSGARLQDSLRVATRPGCPRR